MISILGVPCDTHSSFLPGCRLGPAAIREAFHCPSSNTFAENGVDVGSHPEIQDAGDVRFAEGEDEFSSIKDSVALLLANRHRVVSLGGDHAVTLPILRAHVEQLGPLNVLQLDAHPDLYDVLKDDRYSHACPFSRAHEEGLIDQHVQVGIRTLNAHQRDQALRFGVQVVPAATWREACRLSFSGPVYLSLDLDVLDPAFAPGTSHYEPGGLTVREVLAITNHLDARLIGADIVELNPTRDMQNMTAMVAAKFLKELLGKLVQGAMKDSKSPETR